ncbi:hypothetical protein E2C01_037907 [Portunus trituberculatus]|uniref:Uncharacterized protein n=1 Tax=Portunus trituberculatus TaxID=210409 RepID=A0A5B7F9E2_PORTR|nr:hypothetical protein [Portunus trituberculatus]
MEDLKERPRLRVIGRIYIKANEEAISTTTTSTTFTTSISTSTSISTTTNTIISFVFLLQNVIGRALAKKRIMHERGETKEAAR